MLLETKEYFGASDESKLCRIMFLLNVFVAKHEVQSALNFKIICLAHLRFETPGLDSRVYSIWVYSDGPGSLPLLNKWLCDARPSHSLLLQRTFIGSVRREAIVLTPVIVSVNHPGMKMRVTKQEWSFSLSIKL